MAIKRLKPIQDTFIVQTGTGASFGTDEILELGHCLRFDATGSSRIILEFMTNEVEALLGDHSLSRATLNLKFAHAENLPPVWGVDITEIDTEWTEGLGHVYDIPGSTNGASWYRPKGTEIEEYWEGGLKLDDEQNLIWKHEYFTGYEASKDIQLDVTEWVYNWILRESRALGFLIKLSNEKLAQDWLTRICYYSSETHTVYGPYLELSFDDSVIEGEPAVADPTNLYVEAKNLKGSYYIGERARIDLLSRPEYPRRTFTTSSIYRDAGELIPNARWGLRDEYTGEMFVPFNEFGTRCSYDSRGNYFILDTDLLEPERYYRLLIEVETENSRRIYDPKQTFRVTKHGEL